MVRKRRHNWRTAQLAYMGTDLAYNNRVYSYRAIPHIYIVYVCVYTYVNAQMTNVKEHTCTYYPRYVLLLLLLLLLVLLFNDDDDEQATIVL